MGKVISFANQKGGTGKTTLGINLAVLWSNSGYRVAVIDADKQKSLTNWLEARKKYYGESDVGISSLVYDSTNLEIDIKSIRKKFDFIIIDSPPSISMDSVIIVRASNHIFVPVQPSPLDLIATIPFLDLIKKERKKSTIVLNRVLSRAKLTEAMILRLRYSGAKIARTKISGKVKFAETFNDGRGVVDINVTSPAANEIVRLGKEIFNKLNS